MLANKEVLAIIPARGGSKGIKDKNILPFAGKPLIAWTIEAALNSKHVDRVIVSTDSLNIAGVSREWGAEVPFQRPAELASDTASGNAVVLHALQWLTKHEGYDSEYFILLQPTSPLRTSQHIDQAICEFAAQSQADSMHSVAEVDKTPYYMKTINTNGYLENFMGDASGYDNRQQMPKFYQLNGAMYLMRTKDFLQCKTLFTKRTNAYLMDRISSIDIDDEMDFALAEIFMKKHMTRENRRLVQNEY